LFRPKADLLHDAFIAARKFAKRTTMTLRIDCARKNFYARNPNITHPFRAAIEFAGFDSNFRNLVLEISLRVIARR
jgi:hypothetical protein